jgi:hypothetical protein
MEVTRMEIPGSLEMGRGWNRFIWMDLPGKDAQATFTYLS